jgi:hypothetical protein
MSFIIHRQDRNIKCHRGSQQFLARNSEFLPDSHPTNTTIQAPHGLHSRRTGPATASAPAQNPPAAAAKVAVSHRPPFSSRQTLGTTAIAQDCQNAL